MVNSNHNPQHSILERAVLDGTRENISSILKRGGIELHEKFRLIGGRTRLNRVDNPAKRMAQAGILERGILMPALEHGSAKRAGTNVNTVESLVFDQMQRKKEEEKKSFRMPFSIFLLLAIFLFKNKLR